MLPLDRGLVASVDGVDGLEQELLGRGRVGVAGHRDIELVPGIVGAGELLVEGGVREQGGIGQDDDAARRVEVDAGARELHQEDPHDRTPTG